MCLKLWVEADTEANCILHCATLKNSKKRKYLISANFGALNTKIALKIQNWFWFLSNGRDLIKMSYWLAEEEGAQKGLPRWGRSGQWSAQIYHRLFVQCLTVKVGLFQNSRQILPRLWRGRGKYTLETSASTHSEFFMSVTCAEPHKITQKELSASEIQYSDKRIAHLLICVS
jgi:hypothetical protein